MTTIIILYLIWWLGGFVASVYVSTKEASFTYMELFIGLMACMIVGWFPVFAMTLGDKIAIERRNK